MVCLASVSVDLHKSLISNIRIKDRLQRIEYEGLPNVCFCYGLFGHGSEMCRQGDSDDRQMNL